MDELRPCCLFFGQKQLIGPPRKPRSIESNLTYLARCLPGSIESACRNGHAEDDRHYVRRGGSLALSSLINCRRACRARLPGSEHLERHEGQGLRIKYYLNDDSRKDFFEKVWVECGGQAFAGDAPFVGMAFEQRQRQLSQ